MKTAKRILFSGSLGSYFPCFVVNYYFQFVLFFHRQCHRRVHRLTFSLNN